MTLPLDARGQCIPPLPLSQLIPEDIHHKGIHILCSNTSLVTKVNHQFESPKHCKEYQCQKVLGVLFEGWFWYWHHPCPHSYLPPTAVNMSHTDAHF